MLTARVVASSRHLTRFGHGPMAPSYTCITRVKMQNLEDMRKVHRRLQSWNRRTARAELRTEERFWFCELPDSQTAVVMPHHPTDVTRTTSIMDPSLIKPRNVTNCTKQVHQPQHNHGRLDQDLKQINHGNILAREHSQDLWNPSEYHNWRWLPEHKRIIHRRQMDTTSEQL